MRKFRTHYDNLQVVESASIEVIRGAYKHLSQKWHPDKNPSDNEHAARVMKMINDAYSTLSDPEKRRQHDEWIHAQRERYDDESPLNDRTEEYGYKPEKEAGEETQEDILSPEENNRFIDGKVHPWRRFFARIIDVLTGGVIVYILFFIFLESVFPEESTLINKVFSNSVIGGIILYVLWIPIEAIFLSTISTTPAKWAFGIRILKEDGTKLSFSESISRGFRFFVQGMGFAIPIISLFTNFFAYRRLKKTGTTLWDTSVNATVKHKPLRVLRISSSIALSLFCLLAFGWLSVKEIQITQKDRNLVINASSLTPYFDDYFPSEDFESILKQKFGDSIILEYEYTPEEDDEPYTATTITYDSSKIESDITYTIDWNSLSLVLKAADLEIEENNSFYAAGDRSRFGNIKIKDSSDTIGHIFVLQKDKAVYSFVISGFTINNLEIWRDLFDERIEIL